MADLIFPILEVELIRTLKAMLAMFDDPIVSNVYVGNKKAPDDKFSKQITVRSDGGFIVDTFLKEESFGINIWASTYGEASRLAQIVEAVLPSLPRKQRSGIKKIEIELSSIRINEEGETEQRYLTGTALLVSSTLKFKP